MSTRAYLRIYLDGMNVCMPECDCMRVHVRKHLSVGLSVCLCIYTRIYVCMYVYIYTYYILFTPLTQRITCYVGVLLGSDLRSKSFFGAVGVCACALFSAGTAQWTGPKASKFLCLIYICVLGPDSGLRFSRRLKC